MKLRYLLLVNLISSVFLLNIGERAADSVIAKFEPQAVMDNKPVQMLTRSQIVESSAKYWSEYYGVKVTTNMVWAKMFVESRGRADVVSNAGAVGLMQITAWIAKKVCGLEGDLLYHEGLNIDCGVRIYALHLYERQSEIAALVEYNGGYKCLEAHWRKQKGLGNGCRESENHWQRVMKTKSKLDKGVKIDELV